MADIDSCRTGGLSLYSEAHHHPRLECLVKFLQAPIAFAALALLSSAQQTIELGVYPSGRAPHYEDISSKSLYLKMDDGVRLAIDILLPLNLLQGMKLPTILRWTREGRAKSNASPTSIDLFFIEHGYARVLVDDRGSGASFGVETFGKRKLQDMTQVVNWIVAQPWSDGKVGAEGNSYDGRNAELLAGSGHPAVKAVATRFSDYDDLTSKMMPGGILAEGVVNTRSESVRKRDDISSFKPVDEDRNGTLLKRAVRDHQANPDISRLLRGVTFRDDTIPELNMPAAGLSVSAEREALERAQVPIYVQAGWLDSASAAGAFRRFKELSNAQRLVIGPWNRLGEPATNPLPTEKSPPFTRLQQWADLLSFFDRHLRDERPPSEKQLFYFTVREQKWKASHQWPPAGASNVRFRFSPDSTLVTNRATSGTVEHSPSPSATTAVGSRWRPQIVTGVIRYPSLEDGRLAFTSGPFAETTEMTGNSSVTLRVKSTIADTAFFAYLEILPSFGTPIYVTEGQLRALHRNGSELLRKDGAPLTPGEWTDITFELLPHSIVVEKGERIRLSLAGFDKDTFARIPSSGNPSWTVDCNASFLDLAIARDDNSGPTVQIPETDPDPLGLATWKGRFPQADGYLEIDSAFDHLTVFPVGQQLLEVTARVKASDRPKVAERNQIARTIAEGLEREDVGPLSRSVTLLVKPMTRSLLGEWRGIITLLGEVKSVEVMGTADYPEKNWATSFFLVKGVRGFRVFTVRWSGTKVSGWGQVDGFPVREYYPATDGSFVSAAREGAPVARVRKTGNNVELVP